MLFQALLLGSFAVGINTRAGAKVKNLILFGDSYTDEGRLYYMIGSGGVSPPPGTVIPHSNVTAAGGYSWPYFASQKLGAATYNYAVGGAVCSNEIVLRYLDTGSIKFPFPSVIDDEVPTFKADIEYASTHTNTTFFQDRTPENSVYSLWIGTNDLGTGGFLSDQQMPGKTISDYIDCVWSLFDEVYSSGGRRFVLSTQAPLERSPLYASIEHGGSGDVSYWTNKTAYNTTQYEEKIRESTTTVNTIFDYGAPFQLLVQKRWPGASFTILDAHQIILDIIAEPSKYLDTPANVTGFYYSCPDPFSMDGCITSENPLSSFLWYDSLHPSTRTSEIIGLEFAKALEGNSSYATYYH
ncbi:carbohydrate esterase family 16 protein [Xylaria digitata]|nr:carbohydrate esterase family 16 protein [Xylaria digitata]